MYIIYDKKTLKKKLNALKLKIKFYIKTWNIICVLNHNLTFPSDNKGREKIKRD